MDADYIRKREKAVKEIMERIVEDAGLTGCVWWFILTVLITLVASTGLLMFSNIKKVVFIAGSPMIALYVTLDVSLSVALAMRNHLNKKKKES